MTWKRLTGPGFVQDPEGPGGGKLAAQARPQGWAREGSRCREATRETYGRHPSPRPTGTLCRAGGRPPAPREAPGRTVNGERGGAEACAYPTFFQSSRAVTNMLSTVRRPAKQDSRSCWEPRTGFRYPVSRSRAGKQKG